MMIYLHLFLGLLLATLVIGVFLAAIVQFFHPPRKEKSKPYWYDAPGAAGLSSEEAISMPEVYVVDAPPEKANSELNGSKGFIIKDVNTDTVRLLLISGPHAGREWWFNRDHLKIANTHNTKS
jgi:hypothetical protein